MFIDENNNFPYINMYFLSHNTLRERAEKDVEFQIWPFGATSRNRCAVETIGLVHTDKEPSHLSKKKPSI